MRKKVFIKRLIRKLNNKPISNAERIYNKFIIGNCFFIGRGPSMGVNSTLFRNVKVVDKD